MRRLAGPGYHIAMQDPPAEQVNWLHAVLNDRYEIIENIGHGGMALVYAAHDRVLQRDVAVKILRTDQGHGEEYRERLLREARAVARLVHPHIISVHDVGMVGDTVYIVMERLIGCTVGDLVADGPMDMSLVLEIGCQMASALELAHVLGVTHRDVKPDNLYLVDTATGTLAKLLDFSVAQTSWASETKRLTGRDTMFGTPTYMSPEQASGDAVGPHSDLYSLGVVLYHAVVGHPPYDEETILGVLDMHLNAPIPLIAEAVDDPPIGLSELVGRLMAKSPRDRPESAAEVRDQLAAMLESILERRVRSWLSDAPDGDTSEYAPLGDLLGGKGGSRRSRRRRRTTNVLSAVAGDAELESLDGPTTPNPHRQRRNTKPAGSRRR